MTKKEIPLRFYNTDLYQILLNQLTHFHIHPHDMEASVQRKESKYTVILRFGEEFSHEQTKDFIDEDFIHGKENIIEFFFISAKQCKEVMIGDYYQMMKPK